MGKWGMLWAVPRARLAMRWRRWKVTQHRVINRRGLISARRDGLPDERQRRLLQAEGIAFSVSGVIDLACYSWRGPDWLFLAAEGMNPLPEIC